MISIDALNSEWIALSPPQQLAQWENFITDLDAGTAGFHRYYRVLMPLWDRGDVPEPIHAAVMATYEDEMRADRLWQLANLPFDPGVSPRVFGALDPDLGVPPY